MGATAKRDRKEIYAAVLAALEAERKTPEGGKEVRLTKVASRANVPFDRLKIYLGELVAKGLVVDGSWVVTQAGREFVQEFYRFQRVLERFGFAWRDE